MEPDNHLRRLRGMPVSPVHASDLGRDRMTLATVLALCELDDTEMWLAFISLTGDASLQEFRAFLTGESGLSERDLQILEQALDEQLMSQRMGRMFLP